MRFVSTILVVLLVISTACGQEKTKKSKEQKPDYSNVDYAKKSNILNPDTLQGDQRKIFYHPYFLKLTSKKARNLDPFKVKAEFAILGITTDQRARFVAAYSFFLTFYIGHKKSCENWEYFKDLAP